MKSMLFSSLVFLLGKGTTAELASTAQQPLQPAQRSRAASSLHQQTELQQPRYRSLAIGDFDEFNALFQGAVIRMGDEEILVSEQVGLTMLEMTLKNIRCYDVAIGDITMSSVATNAQTVDVTVNITDLDLQCALDYRYDYGLLRGGGNAVISTDNNALSTTLSFSSTNFEQGVPPTTSTLLACTTNIEVTNMDFDGDLILNIVESFERLIRNTLEEKVEDMACVELGSLGGTFVSNMLAIAQTTLKTHLAPVDSTVSDPLYLESTLTFPPYMKMMNLQDTENIIGKWFDQMLEQVDAMLGMEVSDPQAPNGTGRDLGINVYLRDLFLEDDRSYLLAVADLPDTADAILFEGHDKMTQTTITLDEVKIFGLDTMTRFEPLVRIGKYTLKNELSWQYLTMEFQVTVDIQPSTREDSILENPSSNRIVEKIKIDLGVDNIDVVASLLLAIDQETLGLLQLGPMLHTDNLMACLSSVVYKTQVSGMEVQIGNLREPTLSSFVSPGIDRVVTDAVEAAFAMYKNAVLKAIPSIFQTSIRTIINTKVIDPYMSDATKTTCPSVEMDGLGEFVDWRDMFLSTRAAAATGASGLEPYGDLAHTVADLLRGQYLTVIDNSTGLLELNSLIRSSTKSQSGQEGVVRFPSDLVSFTKTDIENKLVASFVELFEIKLFDTRVHNLDIVKAPVSILQPKSSPHELANILTMGTVPDRPLNITMGFLLALAGPGADLDSPLAMNHTMDVSVSIPSAIVVADFLATVETSKLLHFPLKDILNTNCWLATMPAPELNEKGLRVDGSDASTSLAVEQFALSLGELDVDVSFRNTTDSPGIAIIPDLVNTLKTVGGTATLNYRLKEYLEHILQQSQWVQTQVDVWLAEAPKFCPHSEQYDSKAVATDYGSSPFPDLTPEIMDTIFFAGSLVFDMTFMVVMESHRLRPAEVTNATSAQDRFTNIFEKPFVDWTNLTQTPIGSLVEMALQEGRNYLGRTVTDKAGVQDLGINVVLRDVLFGKGNDGFTFEFDDLGFEVPGAYVSFTSVRIKGLDSITEFELWEPIASQTVNNKVMWDELTLEVDLTVKNATTGTTSQTFKASFSIGDVEAEVPLFVAIDQEKLGSLEIGSLLFTKDILPCLLSALDAFESTQMLVSVGRLDNPVFTGLLPDTDSVVKSFTESVFATYRDQVMAAIPNLFDTTGRKLVNNMIRSFIEKPSCPKKSFETVDQRFIDFRDLFLSESTSLAYGGSGTSPYGDLIRTALDFVKDYAAEFDPETGLSAVNDVIVSPLTRFQSGETGSILFPGNLFDSGTRVAVGGLDAQVQLRASDLYINNLNSVGSPLSILDAVKGNPNLLNNTATFGVDNPVSFGVRFLVSLLGDDDMQLSNELDIGLDMYSANVILATILKIEESRFFSFPIRDILNLDCWMATFPAPRLDSRGVRVKGAEPTLGLEELAANIVKLNLNISCVDCSSPRMNELTELLSKPEAREGTTDAANLILNYVTQLMGGPFLQVKIDRILSEAAQRCPHSPAYDPKAQSVEYLPFESATTESNATLLMLVLGVTLGLIFLVSILVSVVRSFVRRRHKNWLASLPRQQTVRLLKQQEREQAREAELNAHTKSMFHSPDIHIAVRYLMPIVILVNIGFFLSGHISLGATVNIEVELAGERFRVEKFFEFSMAQSTVDIWKAGGEELAILILIFSGIWPYVKQVMTLVIWFLPPSALSISKRESTFLWLDWLGKWSFVDIFVLVISIAAFRVGIVSPSVGFLPNDFYSIDLLVVPMWGLYANMIAQLISQISSHFIIHYHRQIANNALAAYKARRQVILAEATMAYGDEQSSSQDVAAAYAPDDEPGMKSQNSQELLRTHQFGRPHRGESEKLVVLSGVDMCLRVVAMMLTILMIVGCVLPTFSLDILGVVGVAVESGQQFQDATTRHSIVTVIQLLFEEARFLDTTGDYIGLATLSMVLLFTVLIVPIVQAGALLRQWFYPMTRQARIRLMIIIEMLQAWQYSEVYLIAVFVASWQLGPVSQFMINSYCDGLKESFAQLVYFGILKAEDAQCFSVQSSIEGGFYILAVAAVLLALLNTFVSKAVLQYFRDKDELEKKSLDVENASWKESVDTTFIDDIEESSTSEQTNGIHPVRVLFTDTFRWMLRREPTNGDDAASMGSSSSSSSGPNSGPPMSAFDPRCQAVLNPEQDDTTRNNMEANHPQERFGALSSRGFDDADEVSPEPEINYRENDLVEFDDDDNNNVSSGSSEYSGYGEFHLTPTTRQEGGLVGEEVLAHSGMPGGSDDEDDQFYYDDLTDDCSRMSSVEFGAEQPPLEQRMPFDDFGAEQPPEPRREGK